MYCLDSGLYSVSTTCPVCEESFVAIKVKPSALRLDHVDEDFCMHYTLVNPLLYEPWICEHCGYAGFAVNFAALSELEIKKLQELCLMKFTEDSDKNPFELTDFHKQVYKYIDSLSSEGERDNPTAIEAYKILVSNLEARNALSSLKAKVLLRIGWIYRFMKDPREMEYLEEAANYFAKAYKLEDLSTGKFDSATCAYMIGELNRRIGKLMEAMEWFGRVVGLPKSEETSKIVEKARDQLQVIKSSQEYANLK